MSFGSSLAAVLALLAPSEAREIIACPAEHGSGARGFAPRCCRSVQARWGLLERLERCGGGTQSFQTVSFSNSPPSVGYVDSFHTATGSATGTSFTVRTTTGSVCTIGAGNRVNFVAAGTCSIYAYAPASISFFAASSPTVSFTISNKLFQSISVPQPPTGQIGGICSIVARSATSGLPVTTTELTSSVCRFSGNSLCYYTPGTCQFSVSQAGNFQYNAATTITRTSTVVKGTHTVTITSPAPTNAVVDGPSYQVSSTSNRGITPVISASGPCTLVTGTWYRFTGTGTCTISATGGNNLYETDTDTQSFTVGRGTQSVQFLSSPPPGATVGDQYTVSARSSPAGATMSYALAGSSTGCTLAGTTVRLIGGGTCVIVATAAQTANYNAAANTQSFGISLTPQEITWTSPAPPATVAVFGAPYQASATATSGYTVVFSTENSNVCTVNGQNQVTFTGAGTCRLYADQNGVPLFNAAARLTRTWTVVRATQTISWGVNPPTNPLFGGTYSISATASSGLPVTITSSTTATCTVGLGGVVQFIAGGQCVLLANQVGNTLQYSPATQLTRQFTIGAIAQTISFDTTVANILIEGNDYTVSASSTSGLTVSIVVDPASATVCRISPTGVVTSLAPGDCTLNAVNSGNSNYLPAAQVQQTFRYVAPDSPDAFLACDTPALCDTIQANILGPSIAQEQNVSSIVESIVQRYANCSINPWLSPCNLGRIVEVFELNRIRVENLFEVLTNADQLSRGCVTDECRLSVGSILEQYNPVAEAAATSCMGFACEYFANGQADLFKQQVAAGVAGALDLERRRFDSYAVTQAQQKVEQNAFFFAQCSDDACRKRVAADSNRTWAFMNLLAQARVYQTQVANATLTRQVVDEIDRNFTRCSVTQCTIPEVNQIFRQKRAMLRYFTAWRDRLLELEANCTNEACRTETRAALEEAKRNVYSTSDYLIPAITTPAYVLTALVLAGAVAIALLGAMWRVFGGKELFWLVLLGVAATSVCRFIFWSQGASGVGTTSLTFVILDKTSALLFALTILIFVFLWARAISVLAEASPVVGVLLAVGAVIIALVITAITIVYAVSISRDWVAAFYGEYVADRAEIVLVCFTFALTVSLLALILVVGGRLGSMKQSLRVEEKLRNLRIIAVAVGIMVLMLCVRLILVVMRNFYFAEYIGNVAIYLGSTLVPEIVCCLIMLGLVLFTFFQSRNVSYEKLSNSTNGSSSDYHEMSSMGARYDI